MPENTLPTVLSDVALADLLDHYDGHEFCVIPMVYPTHVGLAVVVRDVKGHHPILSRLYRATDYADAYFYAVRFNTDRLDLSSQLMRIIAASAGLTLIVPARTT